MLQSVIRQIADHELYGEVELVISDNCSTDGTSAYVQELQIVESRIKIRYHRNVENVGVVKNLTGLFRLAEGKFSMFYGDDDLVSNNALPTIITTLSENLDLPVFIFKQKGYSRISQTEQISIHDCASRYFYYMGNACSAVNTAAARRNLELYYELVISTCWPHTHLMFLAMYETKLRKPVLVSNIEVYEEQPKDGNNVVNSFYLYDSLFYSLVRLGRMLSVQTGDSILYSRIGKGMPSIQNFSLFCLTVVTVDKLYCTNRERSDFKKTLFKSYQQVKGGYKFYVSAIIALSLLPDRLYIFSYVQLKSAYLTLFKRNGDTFKQNASRIKADQERFRRERLLNMKKPHAIVVNEGDW